MNKYYNIKKAVLVEPNPTNFSKLEQKENYVLYNCLVDIENKDDVLFYEDPNSPYNGSTIFNYFDYKVHNLKSITIKKIIEENDIDYIDILKIDIEGTEYQILENIQEEVLNKVGQITVEFHDFIDPTLKVKTIEIINRIESFGFKRISNPIQYKFNSEHYDVLFYK